MDRFDTAHQMSRQIARYIRTRIGNDMAFALVVAESHEHGVPKRAFYISNLGEKLNIAAMLEAMAQDIRREVGNAGIVH